MYSQIGRFMVDKKAPISSTVERQELVPENVRTQPCTIFGLIKCVCSALTWNTKEYGVSSISRASSNFMHGIEWRRGIQPRLAQDSFVSTGDRQLSYAPVG